MLGVITLITFVPYHYWKWSHRFIGLFFAFSAVHFAFILKPFENSDPLGIYILAFCALGILSYMYQLIPKRISGQTVDYKITDIVDTGNATEVKLSPISKSIKHKAGQFAFVTFDTPDKQEPHPFTISSAPMQNNDIRFTIKHLGDYTSRLPLVLKHGSIAKLSRPFSHFTFSGNSKPQIWIAAGIGITPFMAWAQTLTNSLTSPIKLYYCVPARDQAVYIDELETIAKTIEKFEVILVISGSNKRLSATRIADELESNIFDYDVYFCGPSAMRESLKSDFNDLGLNKDAFHYEEFEIRSGIGVRKFIFWLLALYQQRKT